MSINQLINHLKNCPPLFLKDGNFRTNGEVDSYALIADTFRKLAGDYEEESIATPEEKTLKQLDANHLISLHILCWLFHHQSFGVYEDRLLQLRNGMIETLKKLSSSIKYQQWISDEDRAEELIRLVLQWLDIIPTGETAAEAADRFDALSTIKRQEVLEKSNAAYQRMIEIKRKMAEKKAREAANLYGRE